MQKTHDRRAITKNKLGLDRSSLPLHFCPCSSWSHNLSLKDRRSQWTMSLRGAALCHWEQLRNGNEKSLIWNHSCLPLVTEEPHQNSTIRPHPLLCTSTQSQWLPVVLLHPDKLGSFKQIVYASSSHKSRHVVSLLSIKPWCSKAAQHGHLAWSHLRGIKKIVLSCLEFMKFRLYARRSINPKMHYHMLL